MLHDRMGVVCVPLADGPKSNRSLLLTYGMAFNLSSHLPFFVQL